MRLIYRALITNVLGQESDLRVIEPHDNGILSISVLGTHPDALAVAGFDTSKLPVSVAEGGDTNIAIAEKVGDALVHPDSKITYEWVEPEPKPQGGGKA